MDTPLKETIQACVTWAEGAGIGVDPDSAKDIETELISDMEGLPEHITSSLLEVFWLSVHGQKPLVYCYEDDHGTPHLKVISHFSSN